MTEASVALISTTSANQKRKRTKSGCRTCRIRRVKCDETKPVCKRCSDTGRKCDGYSSPPERNVTFEVPHIRSLDFAVCKRVDAANAFTYFREVSAPALVNFGSYGFWNQLVFQVSWVEDSIKHLIVAASMLDQQDRSLARVPENKTLFAFHYGKAIQHLTQAKNPDTTIILIACLLFIICDDFQQKRTSALQHLLAARSILKDYCNHHTPSQYSDSIRELAVIFQQLQVQTGELDNETMPFFTRWPFAQRLDGFNKPTTEEVYLNINPTPAFQGFGTIEVARIRLQALVHSCLVPLPGIRRPASRFHMVPIVTAKLNQWLSLFDSLCTKLSAQEATSQRLQIHVLRAYHLCLMVMSRAAPFGLECDYDQYFNELEHIVVKAGFLLAYSADEVSQMGEKLLCPLFFVATHYRTIATRRHAVGMLRRCGWSGVRLATIVDELIRLEEKGSTDPIVAADIPESQRIRIVDVSFSRLGSEDVDTTCVLQYSFHPYDDPASSRRHAFEWNDVGDVAVQESVTQLLGRVLNFESMAIST